VKGTIYEEDDFKASVGKYGQDKRQCYNTTSDQQMVQDLLNKIPETSGGAGVGPFLGGMPSTGKLRSSPQWGIVSEELYQVILRFQSKHAQDDGLIVDGHVDPHSPTLRALLKYAYPLMHIDTDALARDIFDNMPKRAITQSALAYTNVQLGISWCQAAIDALQTYGRAFATGSEDADSIVAKALNVHFHFDQISDRSKSAKQMDLILANFTRIKDTLMKPDFAFEDIATSEAAAIFGKSGDASWVPPPAFVARKNRKWIFFTPSFQERSATSGYGPNARTAMVVHEAAHYIDDSIRDYAYEWTSTSQGINQADPTNACVPGSDPKCLYYAALTPEQALNNASCYPTFAVHVVRKFDSPSTRYGAANPTL
jgi:hypothetical protein